MLMSHVVVTLTELRCAFISLHFACDLMNFFLGGGCPVFGSRGLTAWNRLCFTKASEY